MSSLTTNLQTIYTVKQQLKTAIGTESDIFQDYPSYVNALKPSGVTYITENGAHNVASYESAYVTVEGGGEIPPGYTYVSGTYNITANGTGIDIASYESVDVAVPIPAGYIQPSGTITIDDNEIGNNVNVSSYEYAYIDIQGGGGSSPSTGVGTIGLFFTSDMPSSEPPMGGMAVTDIAEQYAYIETFGPYIAVSPETSDPDTGDPVYNSYMAVLAEEYVNNSWENTYAVSTMYILNGDGVWNNEQVYLIKFEGQLSSGATKLKLSLTENVYDAQDFQGWHTASTVLVTNLNEYESNNDFVTLTDQTGKFGSIGEGQFSFMLYHQEADAFAPDTYPVSILYRNEYEVSDNPITGNGYIKGEEDDFE